MKKLYTRCANCGYIRTRLLENGETICGEGIIRRCKRCRKITRQVIFRMKQTHEINEREEKG